MGLLDLFLEKTKGEGAKTDGDKDKPWTLTDVFFERPKPQPKKPSK